MDFTKLEQNQIKSLDNKKNADHEKLKNFSGRKYEVVSISDELSMKMTLQNKAEKNEDSSPV